MHLNSLLSKMSVISVTDALSMKNLTTLFQCVNGSRYTCHKVITDARYCNLHQLDNLDNIEI